MRTAAVVSIAALCVAAHLPAQAPQSDVILRAMKDEMARIGALRVVGANPFYVEYGLDDADLYNASAVLGALVREQHTRIRQPRIRIRVGDPALDNTNHIYSGIYRGSRYDSSQFPLDDNYEALRVSLWLATDRIYKQALEALARKKASLRNISQPDTLPDFSAAEPVKMVLPIDRRPVDEAAWRDRIKAVSAVFASHPEVILSEVSAGIGQTAAYLLTNEGTEIRMPDNLAHVKIRAAGMSADGMTVRDQVEFIEFDAARLPTEAQLREAAGRIAANVAALAKAEVIENYSGPVLFEGTAAAQLMAEVLGRQLTVRRRPVSDPNRPLNIPPSPLEGRIGARILPEWMDAVDDPTQKEWKGERLMGTYAVDIEGVRPQPLVLVEKGILKTYYATRQPIPNGDKSNGHARLPGAFGNQAALAGNLFLRASETTPADQLRTRLIEMGKQRGKDYVIVVRKMDFPSAASGEDLRRIGGGQTGQAVSIPLLCYKVYPDGREEPVRGVRFRGLSTRSLRDIEMAGDDNNVFHYLENGAPFAHMDAGGYVAMTTVVSPSLLFEDLEIERITGDWAKPPIVPPPAMSAP